MSNYSGGILYRENINQLYVLAAQEAIQKELIEPTILLDYAPFISPPYVAMASSWISIFPLPFAFVGWVILNLAGVLAAIYLMIRYIIPRGLIENGLTMVQLFVVVISSFALVFGFFNGQNHGLILLICTGIIIAMMQEMWLLCGFLGSILIYKPQFILGFLIC